MVLQFSLYHHLKEFDLATQGSVGNELAVFFGATGSGKSLTLRMLSGLLQPQSGYIQLGDQRLFHSEKNIHLPPQARRIGYLFQNRVLFPHMTVLENVAFGGVGLETKEAKSKAISLLEKFQIASHSSKYPQQISGGQQQKVALARVLIKPPHLLLLDEPFSGFDATTQQEMRYFLKQTQEEFQIPIILVTHDLKEAIQLAKKMMIFVEGRIVQQDSPTSILTHPAGKDVERLLSEAE